MKQNGGEGESLFSVTTSLGTVSLFSLGIPILVENVLNRMLSTVNTVVLGGFSDGAVAAVGGVSPVINLISLFFSAVATGATVLISNYIGGEKLSRAAKAVFSAVVTCVVFAAIMGLLLFTARDGVVRLLNLEGVVAQYAKTYFSIRILALPVSAASSILYSVLRCYGYTKSTVVAGLGSNVINVLLCIYFIYGSPPKALEGVVGVGLASVTGQMFSLVMGIAVFVHKRVAVAVPKIKEFFALVVSILRIGVPSGLSSGSLTLSQVITTPFIASLGMTALSAKVYFEAILGYTYSFSFAIGTANSLLVGRLCGAREYDHAKRLNRKLVGVSCAVNLAVSLSAFAFRIPLLSLFTDDTSVLKLSFAIFLVDIVAEQARAVSQIYEYALRAAGDVTFSMVAIIISCWVCGVGLNYLFSIPCGLGLLGMWIAISLDETVRAVTTYWRWKTNKWQYKIKY